MITAFHCSILFCFWVGGDAW